ncbi:hypothetical protein C8F04DRAFT_1277240 [Mycena alexandri]|uniref:Uncharacterized protein n=1 Tax=Mycena alexandri TaxID=1745969 RepID=A0AAD6S018_9AGAR|nr:hypothetical protein C8F04DRAFT_1277240 [Mycena alexandri]
MSDHANPPPTASSSPQEGPLSLHAQVTSSILAVTLSLDGTPLNILPATISLLCDSLEDRHCDRYGRCFRRFPSARRTRPCEQPRLHRRQGLAGFSPGPGNEKWFAITRGRYVGLTINSAISLNVVTGVPSGLSERFNSQAEALQHFNAALAAHAIAVFE